MSLQRNFTFREGDLTIHYLADVGRLQAYAARVDPHSGADDQFWQHIDEKDVKLDSRADAKMLLDAGWREELLVDLEDLR